MRTKAGKSGEVQSGSPERLREPFSGSSLLELRTLMRKLKRLPKDQDTVRLLWFHKHGCRTPELLDQVREKLARSSEG